MMVKMFWYVDRFTPTVFISRIKNWWDQVFRRLSWWNSHQSAQMECYNMTSLIGDIANHCDARLLYFNCHSAFYTFVLVWSKTTLNDSSIVFVFALGTVCVNRPFHTPVPGVHHTKNSRPLGPVHQSLLPYNGVQHNKNRRPLGPVHQSLLPYNGVQHNKNRRPLGPVHQSLLPYNGVQHNKNRRPLGPVHQSLLPYNGVQHTENRRPLGPVHQSLLPYNGVQHTKSRRPLGPVFCFCDCVHVQSTYGTLYSLPVPSYLLLVPSYPLPVPSYPLPVPSYPLPVPWCLMPRVPLSQVWPVCCSLLVVSPRTPGFPVPH